MKRLIFTFCLFAAVACTEQDRTTADSADEDLEETRAAAQAESEGRRDTADQATVPAPPHAPSDPPSGDSVVPRSQSERPSFEGIPNFEDVVALRDGDWVVLLASVDGVHVRAPGSGQAAGSVTEASHPDLAEVQQRVWGRGHVPWVVASSELPRLEPGRTLLILGPHTRAVAERRLEEVEQILPGGRLERGW